MIEMVPAAQSRALGPSISAYRRSRGADCGTPQAAAADTQPWDSHTSVLGFTHFSPRISSSAVGNLRSP